MYRTALTALGLATGVGVVALTGGRAQPPLPVVAPAGQPVATDYTPTKSRTQKLGIVYEEKLRKNIQQVRLVVSRDQGQTWQVEDAVTPDKDHLNLQAKEDGLYWVNMVIVFKDGKTEPPDVTRTAPAEKLLIDATPPAVRLTNVQRTGDEIAVEWVVEDKFPDDAATQLLVKPAGPAAVGDYQPAAVVSAPAFTVIRGEAGGLKVVKGTARIKAGGTGPVTVQVVAADLAGNTTAAMKDTGGGTVAGYTPPAVPGAAAEPTVAPPVVVTPPSLPNLAPAGGPAVPAAPVTVPSAPVAPPAPPSEPTVTQAGAPPAAASSSPPVAPGVAPTTPAPNWTSTPSLTPAPQPATAAPQPLSLNPEPTAGQPVPLNATPTPPPAPTGPTQFVRTPQFDLSYQLDIGVSGLRQIDLYVTRDDGRSWVKWSQHDGRENPLRVNLAARASGTPDGDYGLRLVAVNASGLQDDPPTPGSPPDLRVHLDTTPPLISFYPPEPDPAQRNALLLKWVIKDRNVNESSPVAIEWSDTPNGPWRSVTGPDVVQPIGLTTPSQAAGPPKIANRGSYSWTLPTNLPTHLVYFRFTAWDAAGNMSAGVTAPQSIDLVKPRARIQGIVTGTVPAPPTR